MKHILLSLLILCSLSVYAQDVVITRQKKQQTTTTKQNISQKKQVASAVKPKQNEQHMLVSDPTGYLDGHGWVDLRLPSGTLWATCNVGASSPAGFGDYFAWGETQPRKGHHDWEQYKYHQITQWNGHKHVPIGGSGTKEHAITKYDTKGEYGGCKDNKTILEPSDDAATTNWGNEWQMPTREQVLELKLSCKITWVKINGVYGYKVTSKTNGSSIFLPAAGLLERNYSWDGTGCYWTRHLDTSSPETAYTLRFHINMFDPDNSWRYCGASVRAVAKRKILR